MLVQPITYSFLIYVPCRRHLQTVGYSWLPDLCEQRISEPGIPFQRLLDDSSSVECEEGQHQLLHLLLV